MNRWNFKKTIEVKKILKRWPGEIEILNVRGNRYSFSHRNFAGGLAELNSIQEGLEIEVTFLASIVGAKVKPGKFQQKVGEYFNDLKQKIAEYFFMWICEYCLTMGHVTYEDGDDPLVIKKKLEADHQRQAKFNCDRTKLRLFDHRGMEQKDPVKFLSFQKVK